MHWKAEGRADVSVHGLAHDRGLLIAMGMRKCPDAAFNVTLTSSIQAICFLRP